MATEETGTSAGRLVSETLPTAALQRAIGFVLGVVAVRRAAQLPVPAELRHLRVASAPSKRASETVRRVLDRDDRFRELVADQASPALVDEIGLLWLRRPTGWEETARVLFVDQQPGPVHRLDRQRRAAEAEAARLTEALADVQRANARLRLQLSEQGSVSDERQTALDAANRQLDELRARLAASDEARDIERRAAQAHVEELGKERARLTSELLDQGRRLTELTSALDASHRALDDALADLAAWSQPPEPLQIDGVRRLRQPTARQPLAIPGGLLSTTIGAARHLLSATAVVVVIDGYNVAKLGWPELDLAGQRSALVAAAESVARRWGRRVEVFFDGAEVPGSSTTRRLVVHVVYSAAEQSADDAIRARVASIPLRRPVVVVTDDRQIVDDVRRAGCNVVSSATFLDVAL